MNLITQVAEYLMQNPAHMLLVEGHCDERGTEEYNLSLGERRALSVAEELAKLGVTMSRLGTQSFGEKVPVSESNSKESLAKNRRGEFVFFMPMTGVVELPQKQNTTLNKNCSFDDGLMGNRVTNGELIIMQMAALTGQGKERNFVVGVCLKV